jgi:hypothetical protein
MSYVKDHVTSRHKVFVEIDGTLHQLLPHKLTFTVLPDPDDAVHAEPREFKQMVGFEVKLMRHLLRKALAQIDARERMKQHKQKTTVSLTPREAERQEHLRATDLLYEAEPKRFPRAPRGYYERRRQRIGAE